MSHILETIAVVSMTWMPQKKGGDRRGMRQTDMSGIFTDRVRVILAGLIRHLDGYR